MSSCVGGGGDGLGDELALAVGGVGVGDCAVDLEDRMPPSDGRGGSSLWVTWCVSDYPFDLQVQSTARLLMASNWTQFAFLTSGESPEWINGIGSARLINPCQHEMAPDEAGPTSPPV